MFVVEYLVTSSTNLGSIDVKVVWESAYGEMEEGNALWWNLDAGALGILVIRIFSSHEKRDSSTFLNLE